MSFALLIVGLMLVTVAVRNTQDAFINLVKGDFEGPGNFWYWVIALVTVGMLGNIKTIKPIMDGLLVLILLALILSRGNPQNAGGGFFTQFMNAIGTTTGGGFTIGASGPAAPTGAGPTGATGSGGGYPPGGTTFGANGPAMGLCNPGQVLVNGVCTAQ